ncbi:MAG: hypothetical protein E3J65_06330, partial [Dehalococcoidia bacterium]
KILKSLAATPIPGGRDLEPGRGIALAPGQGAALGVETGEGVLGLLRIQLEGRRAMTVEEFLGGQRNLIGALLSGPRLS